MYIIELDRNRYVDLEKFIQTSAYETCNEGEGEALRLEFLGHTEDNENIGIYTGRDKDIILFHLRKERRSNH